MSLWDVVWRVGIPLVVVGGAAATVYGALSDRPDRFSRPHGWQWAWVGIWLMMAGDAAFGENRWWFERTWKGAAALLFATAVAAAAWRHHRWRKRVRTAEGSPPPQ